MSASATAWAQQQRAGKAKFVLVTLADFADDQGRARVSIATLAEITEQSEKTVSRHLDLLEDLNLIQHQSGERAKNGTALIARTQLLINAGSATSTQNEPADKMAGGPPDKMTGGPVKATGQNDRHKEKDSYSLLQRSGS